MIFSSPLEFIRALPLLCSLTSFVIGLVVNSGRFNIAILFLFVSLVAKLDSLNYTNKPASSHSFTRSYINANDHRVRGMFVWTVTSDAVWNSFTIAPCYIFECQVVRFHDFHVIPIGVKL